MAISVAVAVGKAGDKLIEDLAPRVRALKIGPSHDPAVEMGPLVTAQHLGKVRSYVDLGVEEGAELVVDGRDFALEGFQGYENGYYLGGCLFDRVEPHMKIYQDEIFGPVLAVVRAPDFDAAVELVNKHEYGNGTAIFTRDGDASRTTSTSAWSGSMCRSRCRWRSTASAAGSARCSATITCTALRACASTPSRRRSPPAGRPASAPAPSSR